MKDALLHHLIESRTLVAHLNTPHWGLTIPDRVPILIFHLQPQIMEPRLLRRFILDFMRLIVDQCRERTTASPKRQTRDAAPTLSNALRTIDHAIVSTRGGHQARELS